MKQQIAILIIFMVSLHCKEKQLPIQADKAEITSIQASSSLKDAKDKYNVNHLRDKSNKSWCEGNADIGIGERITIVYNNPQKVLVENLYIKNGYGDTKYYSLNGRVKEFKILVDDKEMGLVAIPDSSKKEVIKFPTPLEGNKFSLEIVSIFPGKLKDTCIAELSFADFSIPEPPLSVFCGINFSEFRYGLAIDHQGKLLASGDIEGSGSGGQQCGEFGYGSWDSSNNGAQFTISINISGKSSETCAGGSESFSFALHSCDKENGNAIFKRNSHLDKDEEINCHFTNDNGKIFLGCDN